MSILTLALAAMLAGWPMSAAQAPGGDAPLTKEERAAFVEQATRMLNDKYVFPEVARKVEAHLKTLWASGALDALSDPGAFAARMTLEIRSVSRDKHMVVDAVLGPQAAPPDPAFPFRKHGELRGYYQAVNGGFSRVEKLEDNIGLLAISASLPLAEARVYADLAMKLLSGSDALIVDLRDNEGGAGDIIHYVLGYLLPPNTLVNSFRFRRYGRITEFHSAADVTGKPMRDVPLFVLTSGRTFSAGEEFAFDIQTQKRGTLVGETTGGGANPGGVFSVTPHLSMFIPLAQGVNPVTGGNWEGVGVIPDVRCAADRALDAALPLAREAARAYREKKDLLHQRRIAGAVADLETVERWFDEGRSEEAAAKLEKTYSTAVENGWIGDAAAQRYGLGLFDAGKTAMAYALLKANAVRFSGSGRARNALGRVCERMGRLPEALEAYREAVDLGTTSQDIQTDTFIENRDRVRAALSKNRP